MANITNNEQVAEPTKASSSSAKQDHKENLFQLPKGLLLKMHDLMVKSRVLEERLIKIYKAGDAFFWIGGPGEEAFGVPLGLLTKKGQGVEKDWLHLHYRCTPTMLALGMPMIDSIRLIMNKATDTSTGGRNFSNHYCYPQWNVAPVTSPIEVQYSQAMGTAWVQKRNNTDSVTIVTGGDAGSAEGDFASCLVWASRKGNELPMLITVQNNQWGISTPYQEQHGEEFIAHRGKAFGIKTMVINGNDPEESYLRLQEAFDYIRSERKPVLMEAMVSRLYGHSSASGANKVDEEDCLEVFEKKLIKAGYLTAEDAKALFKNYEQEAKAAQEQVRAEQDPTSEGVWNHFYAHNENGNWREF